MTIEHASRTNPALSPGVNAGDDAPAATFVAPNTVQVAGGGHTLNFASTPSGDFAVEIDGQPLLDDQGNPVVLRPGETFNVEGGEATATVSNDGNGNVVVQQAGEEAVVLPAPVAGDEEAASDAAAPATGEEDVASEAPGTTEAPATASDAEPAATSHALRGGGNNGTTPIEPLTISVS